MLPENPATPIVCDVKCNDSTVKKINIETEMAYIFRRDIPKSVTDGWQIYLHRDGVAHQKFFSDSKWGGRAQALATAKQYRDELLRKYPPLLKRDMAIRSRKKSDTGYIGVTRVQRDKRWVWRARIALPDGKSLTKAFSEKMYGKSQARALAIAARQQMVEQHIAPDENLWKIHDRLTINGAPTNKVFTRPPHLWVNVSVRAATPSLPKPIIAIRVADGVHGATRRSVNIAHHGPVMAKQRAIEILRAGLIALTGEAFTAQFFCDHAAKIKRLPKRGFKLNMPLYQK